MRRCPGRYEQKTDRRSPRRPLEYTASGWSVPESAYACASGVKTGRAGHGDVRMARARLWTRREREGERES